MTTEERPRAQSSLQMRQSGFHLRASRLLQKVKISAPNLNLSILKPSRSQISAGSENNNGPYQRSSSVMKPYMSQPMLASYTRRSSDIDVDDDSSQGSPSAAIKGHVQASIIPQATAAGLASRMDGLPSQQISTSHNGSSRSRHSPSLSAPSPMLQNRTPPSRPTRPSRSIPPSPPVSSKPVSANADAQKASSPLRHSHKSDGQTANGMAKPPHRSSLTALPGTLSTDSDRTARPPTSNVTVLSKPSTRPSTASAAVYPPLEMSLTLPARHAPSRRPSTGPTPLSMRFSAGSNFESGSARLSPSIITRHPPILPNLPQLPTSTALASPSDDVEKARRAKMERRESHVRLRSMPALPLQGADSTDSDDDGESDTERESDIDEIDEDVMEESRDSLGTRGSAELDSQDSLSVGQADDRSPSRASYIRPFIPEQDIKAGQKTPTQNISTSPFFASAPSSSTVRLQTPAAAPRLSLSLDSSQFNLGFDSGFATNVNDFADNTFDVKGKGKGKETRTLPVASTSRQSINLVKTPTRTIAPQKTPTRYMDKQTTDYFPITPAVPSNTDTRQASGYPELQINTHPKGNAPDRPGIPLTPKPGLYKIASKSMVNLGGVFTSSGGIPSGDIITRTPSDCGKGKQKVDLITEESILPPGGLGGKHTDLMHDSLTPIPAVAVNGVGAIDGLPAYGTMKRRRSMPTFNAASPPPPYPDFPPRCRHAQPLRLRDSALHVAPEPSSPLPEGSEPLPLYSNSIYLRAIMPRKVEFTKPGIQARDRKWRRVICELEGTVLRIYECTEENGGKRGLGGWWERKVGVGDISVGAAPSATNENTSTPTAPSESDRKAGEDPVSSQGQTVLRVPASTQSYISPSVRLSPPNNASRNSSRMPTPEPSPLQTHLPNSSSSNLSVGPSPGRSKFVNFLRPIGNKSHGRSISDVHAMSTSNIAARTANSPTRSSFSIPRPTFGASSSTNTSNISLDPSSTSSRGDQSSTSSTSPASAGITSLIHSSLSEERPLDSAKLIKAYTTQNAESGLGNDYLKRKNVIRVRMEGEQFLLQAKDVTAVVEWVEGLQSATSIALDLDERPMPRGPLFPRRRRRRGARRPATGEGDHTPATLPSGRPPATTLHLN